MRALLLGLACLKHINPPAHGGVPHAKGEERGGSAKMSKDVAGVIAPPPLVFLGGLLLGLALERFVWATSFGAAPLILPAAACTALGVFLIAAALTRFRKAGTPARPWEPSTALVETGIYRFTRNPMYLGMSFIYAALALAADSPLTLALLIPTVLVIQFGVIAREEAYMERTFGDAYRAYKTRVRRWM
jgi:protein-S-isoprenylcysteine O-methyltransferase Ste14